MANGASDMPERMWAHLYTGEFSRGGWYTHNSYQIGTEYVLASTHQRVIEALREAEKALRDISKDNPGPFSRAGFRAREALAAIKEHTP